MAHLTQQLEWITVGQTDFSPLETSPGFYRPFVLPPHTVGSTVITKEEEKTTKIAIIIIVVVVIIIMMTMPDIFQSGKLDFSFLFLFSLFFFFFCLFFYFFPHSIPIHLLFLAPSCLISLLTLTLAS